MTECPICHGKKIMVETQTNEPTKHTCMSCGNVVITDCIGRQLLRGEDAPVDRARDTGGKVLLG